MLCPRTCGCGIRGHKLVKKSCLYLQFLTRLEERGTPGRGIPVLTCLPPYCPSRINISLQKNSRTILCGVPRGRESPRAPSTQTQFRAGELWLRTGPRTAASSLFPQLFTAAAKAGQREGRVREAPPRSSRRGRDRKRDGVRGGGAVAARGRGGGARRSLLRLGRERPGRRRAVRGAALNLIDRLTLELTG